jgi:glycosyltransferase involved in cell wall biosynthesis
MKEFNRYFIYVGNAYPHKNLERLVRGVIEVNKKISEEIGLAIVSSRNVFTQRLESLSDKLNAQKYVRLLGFVEDDKLHKLYANAAAFVSASISEGFGLPGLEAMQAGTLVLASDIPVFKEIYKENALYFNPYDVSSISEAMKKVLDMPEMQRLEMIKKARVFIKRYTWSKMAQETLNVYESCTRLRSGK